MTARVLVGDCRDVLATLEANSIDACVTDPPYGLEFMGKEWDRLWDRRERATYVSDGRTAAKFQASRPRYGKDTKAMQAWHETWAREVYRVLKPGGHLLAFSGTRTSHRMVCAIEDAGFEIRDCLMWLYGSGFPKSLDVSKALDTAAGAARAVVGQSVHAANRTKLAPPIGTFIRNQDDRFITAPTTDLAKHYAGYGTALKPAYEPIVLARKPLIGSVAANVTAYGTGGLNVDGCRIGTDEDRSRPPGKIEAEGWGLHLRHMSSESHLLGRWPANLILDEAAAALLDAMSGELTSKWGKQTGKKPDSLYGGGIATWDIEPSSTERFIGDTGGASRFFYTAKSSRAERSKGLGDERNGHPCVKPVDLMQWLVRLVCPKGGTVLDPFLGSGSTGIAADREGFDFIGIEQDAEYAAIARKRIVGDCPLFTTLAAD